MCEEVWEEGGGEEEGEKRGKTVRKWNDINIFDNSEKRVGEFVGRVWRKRWRQEGGEGERGEEEEVLQQEDDCEML